MSATTRILIVEDEPLIRLDMCDALAEAGFDPIEAANAADAIRILEADPSISIVFTDIEMPGDMNGMALAHYVRKRWPPTILIVNSGRERPTPEEMPVGSHFLSKPVLKAALEDLLHRVRTDLQAP